jgi:hypothetical protein
VLNLGFSEYRDSVILPYADDRRTGFDITVAWRRAITELAWRVPIDECQVDDFDRLGFQRKGECRARSLSKRILIGTEHASFAVGILPLKLVAILPIE